MLTTGAVLLLVPVGEVGVLQGIMQAIQIGADATGAGWLVPPLAVVMGLAIGGAASRGSPARPGYRSWPG